MSDKKEKAESYSGVAVVNFVVGTKKPKKYKKGESFTTGDQRIYQSLINNKKIK